MTPLKKSYFHHVNSEVPLSSFTLPELWESCMEREERSGVTWAHPKEFFTYQRLYKESMRISKGLIALGLRKGDVITLFGVRGSDSVLLFLACTSIGVIFMEPWCCAPIGKVMMSIIEDVKPSIIVLGDAVVDSDQDLPFKAAKSVLEPNKYSVYYDRKSSDNPYCEPNSDWASLEELIQLGEPISDEVLKHAKSACDLNEPCYYSMSSGSTGKPKYVLIGSALLTNSYALIRDGCGIKSSEDVVGCPDMATEENFLFICSGFHIGCQVVVFPHEDSPDENELIRYVLSTISHYRVKMCYIGQNMLTSIMMNDRLREQYDLGCLEMVILAGAPTSTEYKRKVCQLAPKSANIYGCTEFYQAVIPVQGILETNPDASGKPSYNVEVKIVDEKGEILPIRRVGELYLRGYPRFLEYKDNPMLTSQVITADNWFRTGDIAYMDEQGLLYHRGRAAGAERLKVLGDVVYPSTIEQILRNCPNIIDCAVTGLQAVGSNGHDVVYAIVPAPDCPDLSIEDIWEFSKQNMNYIMEWPKRIMILDQLPRTTGARRKLSRNVLHQIIEERVNKNPMEGLVEWAEV